VQTEKTSKTSYREINKQGKKSKYTTINFVDQANEASLAATYGDGNKVPT
jgi:hypothetical protein